MGGIALRVAARFQMGRSELVEQDEGSFVVNYLPAHAKALEAIVAKVHKAVAAYGSSGVSFSDKLLVLLEGSGTSKVDAYYWYGRTPPLIQIAPKAYRDPNLIHTLIHELGHYVHDKIVPQGYRNQTVLDQYRWAVSQKSTGEGSIMDTAVRKLKVLEAELRDLEANRTEQKPVPRKGVPFEFSYRDYWTKKEYTLTGKIIGKSGRILRVEVLNAPPEIRNFEIMPKSNGNPVLQEPVDVLFYAGPKPEVDAKIKSLQEERAKLYAVVKSVSRTEEDDRYKSQRHAWVPTAYARKNAREWFAELCTTFILGHAEPEVGAWLKSVIKTGNAPSRLELGPE